MSIIQQLNVGTWGDFDTRAKVLRKHACGTNRAEVHGNDSTKTH